MSLAEFTWLQHSDRMSRDELRIGAAHVKELLEHPGLAFIERVCSQAQQDAVAEMVRGGPHEQAKYAQLSGRVGGLRTAFEAPRAIVIIAERAMTNDQRLAEQAEAREGRAQ